MVSTMFLHRDVWEILWPGRSIAKMYGPYRSGVDGRRYMIISFEDGSKTSISYARLKMTNHLGYRISDDLHVDHIDGNPRNDQVSNYQLLTSAENTRKSNAGKPSPLKGVEKGFTHGTTYGWMKKGCRCDPCKAKMKERNSKRRVNGAGSRGAYGRPAACGSQLSYTRGCRCDRCRKANTVAERKRSKGEGRPPTDQVIA